MNQHTDWRTLYHDAVAECEALKKAHDENVKLLKEFKELFKDADKEITELRRHCEAMAEAMQRFAYEPNHGYPYMTLMVPTKDVIDINEALKNYDKFKEGE